MIQMARSKEIAPSVGRLSRSQLAAKRGLHKGELALVMVQAQEARRKQS